MKNKKRGGKSNAAKFDVQDDEIIPTLTDVVTPGRTGLPEAVLGAVQADLSARVMKLAEELVHNASREMEAVMLERVCDRLRDELPQLIDATLRAPLKRTIK